MRRKGFTLIEALVALFIIAAPLAAIVDLGRGNVRGAKADADRFVEEQMLADTIELLTAEPIAVLRKIDGDAAAFDKLIQARVRVFSAASRPTAARAAHALAGQITCRLEENVGGHEELVRVALTRRGAQGRADRTRLFRTKRRALAEMLGEDAVKGTR